VCAAISSVGHYAALLGGGAYETSFADDLVVTMTGVPGAFVGPAAAKAAINATRLVMTSWLSRT
jgi:hypothetical protein